VGGRERVLVIGDYLIEKNVSCRGGKGGFNGEKRLIHVISLGRERRKSKKRGDLLQKEEEKEMKGLRRMWPEKKRSPECFPLQEKFQSRGRNLKKKNPTVDSNGEGKPPWKKEGGEKKLFKGSDHGKGRNHVKLKGGRGEGGG